MKNNWLITQTVVGLVVASLYARAAELPGPVPDPAGDKLGYPTNDLIALELGRADASRDVSQGVLRLPIYGSPIEWSSDFSRILEEKYKIDRYGLGGPLITPGLTEYARGYGEISERAIHQKFGSNFFERVQQEARQAHDQRMQADAVAPAAPPATAAATIVVSLPIITAPVNTASVVAAPLVDTAETRTPATAKPMATTPAVTAPAITPTAPPDPAAPWVAVQGSAVSVAPPVVAQSVAPANRTYRVKPGDTFWEIARQHRVPVSSLVAANPGVNPGKLQINHTLNVPTATRP